MGSQVSAVVANLYMEFFEELALEWHRPDPGCGKSMLMILSASSGKAQPRNSFAISTGSGRPSSSLWNRKKTGHSLNTLLRRREDGSLDVSVYRKPTHTNRHLHFESHHPTHVKTGVVRCLHDRTKGIIRMQYNLQKEVDHLARVLKQNGYPANFICNAFALPTQETAHTGNSRPKQPRRGTGDSIA